MAAVSWIIGSQEDRVVLYRSACPHGPPLIYTRLASLARPAAGQFGNDAALGCRQKV
jgi:hypothetical protein